MSLEEQVRAALSPALRERAQVYAREGGVVRVAAAPDEAAYLVTVPGARAPFEVTLWPNEPDWACTCGAPALCAHVAAAWYLHAAGPAAPPPTVTVARVRYRFTRAAPFLLLDRDVPANALRRDVDSEMNRVFAGWWGRKGSPKGLMQRALAVLAGVPEGDITLDGAPVRCDGRPVLPRILVQDHGGGFRVRLVRADGIDEAFADGVLRMGSTLRPIGEADLDPAYARRLQEGIVYDRVAAESLVTTDLPKLRKLLEVEVRTERLPERVDVPPRIAFEVRADGGRARVVPRLVYGEPAVARVERGEVVRLGRATPVRDLVAESALVRRLAEAGMSFDVPVERTGAGAALWARQLPQWARAEVLRHAPSLRVEELTDAPTVRAIPIDGGWQVDVDAGGVDPQALVAAWQAGESLVPLLGGGWRTLPRQWLETHGHVLAELLSARDAAGRVTRAAGPMLMEALGALDAPVPADLQVLRALAGDFDAIPDVPLPSGFRAALRPYQQRGVAWLSWLRSVGMGGILADDMGLGKTVQTLAALAVSGGPALVVAPTSVLRNWANEAARFAPDLRVCVYWGPRRQLDPSADLVITTYAVLRLDLEALAARRWRTVVLDEAQAIKNPESQAAQAAYRLDAELRLALTGTPVENRLEELWSAFHFVTPGLLGGRKAFRERFSGPIERGDRRAQQTLRARIRPFVLRRLKSEVARDLPPRTDVVLRCALSDEERAIYESVRTLGREDVARLLAGGRTLQVLEILLRMRQAACHTGLLPGKGAAASAKVDLLLETLDQVLSEGHRALVFSQWTSLLDLLEAPLRARGLAWARLDGSTRDRAGEVERFNAPDGPPLFLLSLKAGGTGLNLTAADYVFHLDPWWNPAVEDQATDRAHRIGQDRPVVSCRIIADDTVEERILELQERKRSLARAALDEDALAQALTRDDLLALFD